MQALESFEPGDDETDDGAGGGFQAFIHDLEAQLAGLRVKAVRLESTASDAEDLVQDTVERALRSRHRFEPGTNLRSWLHTIMHNLFLDRCRSRNRWQLSAVDVSLPEEHPAESEAAAEWALMTMPEIQDISDQLSRPLREAVELVLFAGLDYEQASRRLQIPRATVGTRLLRARRQMRSLIVRRLDAAQAPVTPPARPRTWPPLEAHPRSGAR